LIVLAHLSIDELFEQDARLIDTRVREVKVVEKEQNDPSAIERDRRDLGDITTRSAARRRDLRFFVSAAGCDAIEEPDVALLAFDLQNKLILTETVDEVSLLVEHHEIGLDEISVDSNNVIAGSLWFLRKRSESERTTRRGEKKYAG